MLFNSLEYAIFLPAAWVAFWLVPSRRLEVMLVASYVFYASWSAPYAAMVFVLVVMNYLFGLVLGRIQRHRRIALAAFVGVDLGVLFVFKYFDFGLGSLAAGAHALGAQWDPPLLRLILPLGISFFTFEFIHYLVDIHRGDVPVHSFSKFHVFAAFFPTQIAGPIKRFQQFVPSLATLGRFDTALAREGLWLIGFGLMKKVLLADRLAVWTNRGFGSAASGSVGTADAWLTAVAFTLQIYFDFSGYTDIARGSAALFGFRIPINFDAPYLATSLSSYWRRWHISLSTWLRDYLYIPLGGSRGSRSLVTRNLLIAMTLGGLWHGAAWHFVVWGAFWGVGLAVQHALRDRFAPARMLPVVLAGWLFTQAYVVVGLVIFRSDGLGTAGVMLRAMAGDGSGAGAITLRDGVVIAAVALALIVVSLLARSGWRPRLALPLPLGQWRPALVGMAAACVILFGSLAVPNGREAFIYFQF
jgi:alginate O-acetyltransferase complex protein AlgI